MCGRPTLRSVAWFLSWLLPAVLQHRALETEWRSHNSLRRVCVCVRVWAEGWDLRGRGPAIVDDEHVEHQRLRGGGGQAEQEEHAGQEDGEQAGPGEDEQDEQDEQGGQDEQGRGAGALKVAVRAHRPRAADHLRPGLRGLDAVAVKTLRPARPAARQAEGIQL